jgi:hypothetical protein
MVKRLLILPTITKTLATGTSLPAVADPTGQTVTPSNYVGFPAAGTAAITYLRLGKAGVVQSQEVVLVDLETRPWPVLQRSVNGSPLVAHDASHGIETIVPPDGLAALIGVYQNSVLVLNTAELDLRGATVTNEDGVAVIHAAGGGGSVAASPAVLPSRIRAAAAVFNSTNFT